MTDLRNTIFKIEYRGQGEGLHIKYPISWYSYNIFDRFIGINLEECLDILIVFNM